MRERGDAVAAAQTAAERTQLQAAQLLGRQQADRPHPGAGEPAD